jgi:hypothetical protein
MLVGHLTLSMKTPGLEHTPIWDSQTLVRSEACNAVWMAQNNTVENCEVEDFNSE